MSGSSSKLKSGLLLVPPAVAAALAAWQLQRMQWKADLLAQLGRNGMLPVTQLDLDAPPEALLFRRIRAEVRCNSDPQERAGRNRDGRSGYSVIYPNCTVTNPGESAGLSMAVNAGWMTRPGGAAAANPPSGLLTGMIVPSGVDAGLQGYGLVLETAEPPLMPSAPPGLETISNNHLSYAVQWFSFAAILAVIYGLWLRRWLATNRPRP